MIGGNGHDAGGLRDHGTGDYGQSAGNSSDKPYAPVTDLCGAILVVMFTICCTTAMIISVAYYTGTLFGLWR